jgi:hypothetical protein
MATPEARIALHRSFEERFRKPRGYPAPPPPSPIPATAVATVEAELLCHFPDSYRAFVTTVGPCQVRGLGDAFLSGRGLHESFPQPFESLWGPQTVLKQVREEWFAPIPAEIAGGTAVASDVAWKYLLPFASDAFGNWHCFPRQPARQDDLPVYYFDHDGGAIERIAEGLDELLEQFLRIPIGR